MDKVFLDCGAHCGCSRRKIKDEFSEYTIYSFEPNSDFNKYCDKLINKAIWIYDGTIDFFQLPGLSAAGSSIYKDKAKYTAGNNYIKKIVECIDLAKLINSFSDSEIILKMDIEGAEYTVLPHLIECGVIDKIKTLYIEWHHTRCGISEQQHNKLIQSITVPILDWSGMKKNFCIKHMGMNYTFDRID